MLVPTDTSTDPAVCAPSPVLTVASPDVDPAAAVAAELWLTDPLFVSPVPLTTDTDPPLLAAASPAVSVTDPPLPTAPLPVTLPPDTCTAPPAP